MAENNNLKETAANEQHNDESNGFAETISKSEAFISDHKKGLLIGTGAVLAVIAAFFLSKEFYFGPREIKASTELAKPQQLFNEGDFEKALKGDKGTPGFLSIIDTYSCTDAANLANAYAGICYAQTGKYKEAVKYLEDFDGKDQMVGPSALGTLGNCYAQLKEYDKAVSTLKKAASKADNNSLSPIFLVQAGEILESQNNYKEALECYEQIKTKYVQSMQAQDIDKYIERAKANIK